MQNKKKVKRVEINSKEVRINLEQIQKDMKEVYGSMKRLIPESLNNKEVESFGEESHIILPKKYAGKKATIIIRNGRK